jgi:putative hydrolase of the HAD superfamily
MEIQMIAFDADDTLWHGEVYYQDALVEFKQILSPWDEPESIESIIAEIEMRNLPMYGYGIKAFVLSMIEAAIRISDNAIPSKSIQRILAIGRSMIESDIVLLPHVSKTLDILYGTYQMMVITKGDLLDQTTKVTRSGLEKYFPLVEVLNDKTAESYQSVFKKYTIDPQSLVMVGNSIRSDIHPILTLGGTAVYIPANTTWEHEMVHDFDTSQNGFYEIEHIGQLPDLITEINQTH